jgi:hypothetical protein
MKGDLNMRNYDRMVKRRKSFSPVWDATKRKRANLEHQAGIESTKELRDNGRTEKIRELYFSVTDPVIRRALIIVEREDHEAMIQFWNKGVEEAQALVERAQSRADIPFRVWVMAAVCGVVVVAAGQAVAAGLTGAIGGGVAGTSSGRALLPSTKDRPGATWKPLGGIWRTSAPRWPRPPPSLPCSAALKRSLASPTTAAWPSTARASTMMFSVAHLPIWTSWLQCARSARRGKRRANADGYRSGNIYTWRNRVSKALYELILRSLISFGVLWSVVHFDAPNWLGYSAVIVLGFGPGAHCLHLTELTPG